MTRDGGQDSTSGGAARCAGSTWSPRPASQVTVRCGDLAATCGLREDYRGVLEPLMRACSARELPPRLLALAARHGLAVTRVTVRSQRSRWGSCSRDGNIALNWRLLQMPTDGLRLRAAARVDAPAAAESLARSSGPRSRPCVPTTRVRGRGCVPKAWRSADGVATARRSAVHRQHARRWPRCTRRRWRSSSRAARPWSSQLKRSGHKDVAARIAAATKPSRAAYLVNQVFWRSQPIYDAVLDAGTAARAAQQARLLGDAATDVGETLRVRDDAVEPGGGAGRTRRRRRGTARQRGHPRAGACHVRGPGCARTRGATSARATHHRGRTSRPGGVCRLDPADDGTLRRQCAASRWWPVVRKPHADAEPAAAAPDPRVVEAAALRRGARRASCGRRRAPRGVATHDCRGARRWPATRSVPPPTRRGRRPTSRQAAERAEASRLSAEQDLARLSDERAAAEARLRELQAKRRRHRRRHRRRARAPCAARAAEAPAALVSDVRPVLR